MREAVREGKTWIIVLRVAEFGERSAHEEFIFFQLSVDGAAVCRHEVTRLEEASEVFSQ